MEAGDRGGREASMGSGRAATRAFTVESVLYHFAPLPLAVSGFEPPLRSRVEGNNFLALLGRWIDPLEQSLE